MVSTDEPPDISKAFAVLSSPVTVRLPSALIARVELYAGCGSNEFCDAPFEATFKTPSYPGDDDGFPI